MKPVVVTMATDDRYLAYARKLAQSCDAHGLPCMIVRRPDLGTWVENTNQKPDVIRTALNDSDGPVLWIDADAEVRAEPALLYDSEADFAIHAIDRRSRRFKPIGWPRYFELPPSWPDTRWFLSGTVYVAPTPAGHAMVDEWSCRCRREPRGYEQFLCQEAWCNVRPETLWLPPSYCSIFGRTKPPVIWHDLASTKDPDVVRH